VFGATSDVLYSGGRDGDDAIIEWKLAEGREATVTRRLRGHTNWVRGMVQSPCNEYLASTSNDGTVRIWGLATGKEEGKLESHTDQRTSVPFFLPLYKF
jgi:WD40 repeat protein